MLSQIVTNTPTYVWAILGFLAYRGVQASRERVVAYRSLFVMPAVMLALALQGIAGKVQANHAMGLVWLGAMALGAALAWRFSGSQVKSVDLDARTVLLRGSWAPLVLMLSLFVCKYAVGVLAAVRPELAGDWRFVAATCTVFGLFNGAFNGRLLRCIGAFQGGNAVARAA